MGYMDTKFCELCDEDYNYAAPECPGCVARRDGIEQAKVINQIIAERDKAVAERDEARKWLAGICAEFEGAVAHADWRAAGSKGMSVPFTGDFADVTRHPGVIGRMRWWVREFRSVLGKPEDAE